jgi:hypothetical protein
VKATLALWKIAAVLGLFLVGSIAGYLFRGAPFSRNRAGEALAARLAELEQDNADLRRELDRLRAEERNTRKAREAEAKKEARKEAPAVPATGKRSASFKLESLDEVDTIFKEALTRGDIKTLLEIAASLIDLGEEGYEKLGELSGQLEQVVQQKDFVGLWLQSPMLLGRMLRAAADHDEGILRFILHLQGTDPEDLPPFFREVRQETGRRWLWTVLLGFQEGDDPSIERGFTDLLQRDLDEGIPSDPQKAAEAIHGLAQLRSPESFDLLLGIIDRVPEHLLGELALALALRGDPRAIPALRSARDQFHGEDSDLLQSIDAAIRLLEPVGR